MFIFRSRNWKSGKCRRQVFTLYLLLLEKKNSISIIFVPKILTGLVWVVRSMGHVFLYKKEMKDQKEKKRNPEVRSWISKQKYVPLYTYSKKNSSSNLRLGTLCKGSESRYFRQLFNSAMIGQQSPTRCCEWVWLCPNKLYTYTLKCDICTCHEIFFSRFLSKYLKI